jgi:hypothetical protein
MALYLSYLQLAGAAPPATLAGSSGVLGTPQPLAAAPERK